MISFESDYIAGAHPEVLKKLAETNLESLPGYGSDPYCESAKQKIREAVGISDAEIFFLAGGTQANAVVISAMLAQLKIPAMSYWSCRRKRERSSRTRWNGTWRITMRMKTMST